MSSVVGGLAAWMTAGMEVASAQPVEELPPIVVEGATVDKPKVTVKKTPSDAGAQGAVPGGPETSSEPATEVVNGVPADEVGSSVTVVTGTQLKAQQIRHAADALRSLPGASVTRTGGFGSLTQIRIRGAEGNHTPVLIDGIDAGDTSSGEFDFSNLLVEDIDRIEMIRGGQSGIGGSKAIGGVINIITRDGKGPLTFTARTEGGSFNTREIAGRVSAGNDKFWFSLSGNVRDSDGFNLALRGHESDPWRLGSFNARGGAELLKGVTLDFSLRHMSKDLDYDGFDAVPWQTYSAAFDEADYNHTSIWLGGAKLTWDSFDGAFTQVLQANRNTTDSSDNNRDAPNPTRNKNEASKVGYLATYRFGPKAVRSSITGMIQKEEESFTPFASYADGIERERSRLAYVGEYRAELFDRLFPTASVRRDDNDTFGDYTTWHAALSLKLPELAMRPHGSVGTSVSLPGMFEQFGTTLDDFRGNPNLKPEQSFGWDAGVELTVLKGQGLLDVTYFRADLTDEIGAFFDPVTFFFTPINRTGESTREGLEISGHLMVTDGLSVGASYTRLLAYQPNGQVEVRRPRDAGRIDVNYAFDAGRANVSLAAIYNGETEDDAFLPVFPYTSARMTLDDYWLVNAAASYKLSPGVEVYGRVENLLDEKYEEVYSYATPGLSAYAGIRLTYEELATKSWSEER